ncbi:MAG: ADP-ribosylglycohydrolase family protein [Alistipes senegalensis]|nr:ADP-ribosylglycohydrolase family protein [Bacteroides cellulosilyticus]MCM1351250.1 ADP-ribosylglycohydrolase family protein [Alistipes senegalensis]
MIGAIIGDIVGSRFEFNNAKSGNFALFTKQCDFTDDTICTVAVADAILRGEDYRTSILRWCRKYPNPMGAYGASFSRWLNSPDPQPYNSSGNGAAMRVSPVAWACRSMAEVIREATETAKISHDHTEGIIGAVSVAELIYWLKEARDIDSKMLNIEYVATRYYGEDWEQHLIPRGQFDETCQGCVPLAFHIIKESTSFEDAIRKAILYGGDSDTLGAIVGSLAEAQFGIDIPMMQKAIMYLPYEMQIVVQQFRTAYR